MRIGIFTHHWVYNFGANLQALATQSALVSMGFDPIFINYREPSKVEGYKTLIRECQVEKHEFFCQQFLNEGPLLTSDSDVEDYCRSALDIVIVGSDAVFSLVPKYDPLNMWRKLRNSNFKITEKLPPQWLNWKIQDEEKDIFKASIAASAMGTNYYFLTPKLRKELDKSISDFNYISVRDDWTWKMLSTLYKAGDREIEICPDPVFSLNSNFTFPDEEIFDTDVSKSILMGGNFNSDWLNKFIKIAHKNGFNVGNCPNPDNEFINNKFDFIINLPLSPLQWYNLLSNCAGYIGVRFHALVTCIANQTAVINIDPHISAKYNKTGSKMYDLCRRSGIKDNFFTPKKLRATDPEKIFRLLFDKSALKHTDQYRQLADKKFNTILEKIIISAKKKWSKK